jgi:hypothetical protein
MNCNFRSFRPVVVLALVGIGAVTGRAAFADTNLVNEKFWAVDGTDDSATNASSIAVTVKGQAMGAFTELAFSYNIDGTNVVPVCLVKGSGEIQMAVPNGPFGGSFFLTGYWDCDAGYVPTMVISNLDIRLKGGKEPMVELKGKISNQVSMAAKNFELMVFVPKPQLMKAELNYTLMATTDFCVDEIVHTNEDNFQVARMASNYLSPATNENDVARFVKGTSQTCVLEFCGGGSQKSICYVLADQDSLVVTNHSPRLGGNPITLMNDGSSSNNTPTLAVRFMNPSPGQIRPQGLESASSDPTAENVSYWGDWVGEKGTYRAKKKVEKMRYILEVSSPGSLSCDYSY